MSKNLKFSIITPSYNQSEYIEQTIKSIVSQNYPRWEYFIFDAVSTDKSVEIIKKYAKKYPNHIYWESKKDKGQADAINKGLLKATGDIICYLNSDDYYLPGTFAIVNDYFNQNPDKLWLVGNCQVSDPKLRWTFWFKHLWPIDKYNWALPVFNTINQPSSFLTRKLVNQVGLFNINFQYAFDYDYWLRCLNHELPGRIHKYLSVFRIHNKSKGNTNKIRQFEEDSEIIYRHYPFGYVQYIHRFADKLTIFIYKLLKK